MAAAFLVATTDDVPRLHGCVAAGHTFLQVLDWEGSCVRQSRACQIGEGCGVLIDLRARTGIWYTTVWEALPLRTRNFKDQGQNPSTETDRLLCFVEGLEGWERPGRFIGTTGTSFHMPVATELWQKHNHFQKQKMKQQQKIICFKARQQNMSFLVLNGTSRNEQCSATSKNKV